MSRSSGLPQPSLSFISKLRSGRASDNSEDTSPRSEPPTTSSKQQTPHTSPSKSRRLRKDSLENIDADPWASPALHKGHTHTVENEATPTTNGTTAVRPLTNGAPGASRTTSTFTTHADDQSSIPTEQEDHSTLNATESGAGGWNPYEHSSSGFGHVAQGNPSPVGFGSGGDDPSHQSGAAARRSLGGGRTTHRGVDEVLTVTLLPEKEGMFLFQHRNYEVKSARRASMVVRRYSDFVWLLDCLHRRYPFRQLPLLPPKTVAGKSSLARNREYLQTYDFQWM